MEAKRVDLDAKFGYRGEEDRTVTARSPRAALSRFALANPSPPSPMPFFPSNNQGPSPRSPTASVFSVPYTIHTFSSLTPFVYDSHPRPMAGLALLPLSPPIQRTREAAVTEEPSPPRGENSVGRYGRAIFVLG